MRTLEDINNYLSDKYCKLETDAIAIQKIIEDKYNYKITINHYAPNLALITFNEFKSWLTDFNPTPGSILINLINNVYQIFIVKEVLYGGFKSLASFSSNKKLNTKEEWIDMNESIRFADEAEQLILTNSLKENSFHWMESRNIVLKTITPEFAKIMNYTTLDSQGICIYDKISKEGDVICFAILEDSGHLEFQYPVILKNADNVIFSESRRTDQERIKLKLNESNKQWDIKSCRIDDLQSDYVKGVTYHYLNDSFNVCTTYSKCTKKDSDRFVAGNYITNYEEIIELQEIIQDKIKEIKSRKK